MAKLDNLDIVHRRRYNKLDPVRVIFRRALRRDEIADDPTVELELPSVRGRRDCVATRTEAAALIDALPGTERALWATAFYAGLRRGGTATAALVRRRPRVGARGHPCAAHLG